MVEETRGEKTAADVIVAGHICLDIIPEIPESETSFAFRPGTLTNIGSASTSTGGCVPNTGLALHQLGATTRLLGKIGNDAFGEIVCNTLANTDENLTDGLVVAPNEHTSYSVILSPPGEDRMVLHFPGANETFVTEDVLEDAFSRARVFHFGYPPVMRSMYQDDGENLTHILQRAKSAGLTTSLDMAYPDPASPAGQADWRRILERALPLVDVFLPSLEEVLLMLEPETSEELIQDGSASLAGVSAKRIANLGERLVEMGAGIVGLKLGERGLYLRTSSEERLLGAGPGVPHGKGVWANRELWSTVFEATVVGTNGAGDATVAGFLFGLLKGMSPENALAAACAVGASSVEAADATAGIGSWHRIRERIDRGWARRRVSPGEEWTEGDHKGMLIGPLDASRV